jgi:hypothetical protein
MKDLMDQTEGPIKHISDSRSGLQANIAISNKKMSMKERFSTEAEE